MILSIISAIGKNGELGKDNHLLWNLPADMKHFRETTSGHPVIMGRKTYESIGHPLPKRENVVITRDANWHNGEVLRIAHSFEEALSAYKGSDVEVFIIGGGQLYHEAIPIADRLYITHIDAETEADTFFPNIDPTVWKEVSRVAHKKDHENSHDFDFTVYVRKDI